jgi:hypothetical protein
MSLTPLLVKASLMTGAGLALGLRLTVSGNSSLADSVARRLCLGEREGGEQGDRENPLLAFYFLSLKSLFALEE